MSGLYERSRAFARMSQSSMLILALLLALLWYWVPGGMMDPGEEALWRRIRAGQGMLAAWRDRSGVREAHPDLDFDRTDPHRTGLIGVEWSPITTTLGPLEAKRTAADPLWGVWALRQFRRSGLAPGDSVVLLASSSFPGLVFSLVAAAERYGLDLFWIQSLGSSTWGANMPEMPWPVMGRLLREGGCISSRPNYYTLGGGSELGRDMSPEGLDLLTSAAAADGVPLLKGRDLGEMIGLKSELALSRRPVLAMVVGGSHTTFGPGEVVPPGGGLYSEADLDADALGRGVFRNLLESGVPVLHFLDLRSLALRSGISYDGAPRPRFSGGVRESAVGLLLFALYLGWFSRWRRDE